MATTTRKEDYLGRDLVNADPGTSDATDFAGRAVQSGNVDYLGRALSSAPWGAEDAVAVGDVVYLTGDEELTCTVAGTTDALEPTAPAVGETVEDGTATWLRTE